VQVVLGEAERADGLLRFVLEAEGFDLVGLASNDEELERVLRGARPSVVVLDGGISAAAALHARECLEDAALVVVWPDGVSAVLAEERVEPNLVIEDLGDAVRRAADRLRQPIEPIEPIVVPDAEDDGAEVVLVESVRTDPPAAPLPRHEVRRGRPWLRGQWVRGRKMQILVGATTWFLAITALAAIATAVPHVVDTFRGGRSPGLSPSVTTEPQSRTDTTSDQTSGEEQQDRCADPVSGEGNASAQGNGTPVRAQGCPPEKADGRNKDGGGRPDDPGSQGNGGASGGQGSNGENGSTDDGGSPGSSGEDHVPAGSGKPEGTESGPKSEPKAEGVHGRADGAAQGARDG
jgi:uncharacterized membrane protein YgcG